MATTPVTNPTSISLAEATQDERERQEYLKKADAIIARLLAERKQQPTLPTTITFNDQSPHPPTDTVCFTSMATHSTDLESSLFIRNNDVGR